MPSHSSCEVAWNCRWYQTPKKVILPCLYWLILNSSARRDFPGLPPLSNSNDSEHVTNCITKRSVYQIRGLDKQALGLQLNESSVINSCMRCMCGKWKNSLPFSSLLKMILWRFRPVIYWKHLFSSVLCWTVKILTIVDFNLLYQQSNSTFMFLGFVPRFALRFQLWFQTKISSISHQSPAFKNVTYEFFFFIHIFSQ